MVEKVEYLTPEGKASLEKKLEYLINVRRPEVAERLKLALEDGGELIENNQYEEAKNEQAFVEAEITRASQILRNAIIITDTGATDTVQIGCTVTVMERGTKETEDYRLVGPAEANPSQGKISIESPLGQALVGQKVGDKVTISAPDGDITFVIKSIS
ncbi:MAG: transcription elongation factor GreA [Anaerolineae bacterium]|nr:transcription elongation factor GreA [Anaerolineae bacterium]MCA9886793.1 transcription elongation factor GreA [Anaerolineae bacterium]MCB9461709.1 transcription elongation factor GreA [Anaerolineaceae bacterium]